MINRETPLTLERYVRRKQIELAKSLVRRAKIYLDLRFWIILRDAASGIRQGVAEQKLLEALRRGVADGDFVCPISDSVFFELMKQRYSDDRRIGTARLVDELSLGVTLTNSRVRAGTEIYSLLLSSAGFTGLYPMQELVWTKLCYVLGEVHPSLPDLDPTLALEIQKSFVDEMWGKSLADMVQAIGPKASGSQPFVGLGAETNIQRDLHADEVTSFEKAYELESAGAMDACKDLISDAIASMAELNGVTPSAPGTDAWLEAQQLMTNLLIRALWNGNARKPLRTLHIEACFHATLRWEKERRFKDNDFHDFRHAAAAIGYCDAFFTEGPLAEMANRAQLRLSEINGCRVTSDIAEASELLLGLKSARAEPVG